MVDLRWGLREERDEELSKNSKSCPQWHPFSVPCFVSTRNGIEMVSHGASRSRVVNEQMVVRKTSRCAQNQRLCVGTVEVVDCRFLKSDFAHFVLAFGVFDSRIRFQIGPVKRFENEFTKPWLCSYTGSTQ